MTYVGIEQYEFLSHRIIQPYVGGVFIMRK